jgi:hypothetical protein
MNNIDFDRLPAVRVAKWLGVGHRQLNNFVNEGLPRHGSGVKARFSWPEVLDWYMTKKAREQGPHVVAQYRLWRYNRDLELALDRLEAALPAKQFKEILGTRLYRSYTDKSGPAELPPAGCMPAPDEF